MTTDKEGRAPLYVRALRLRNLHVGGFGSFVLFECMIAVGVLLALAELVTWWAVLVLPVAVAAMVKINDVAMSGSRARRAAGARERTGLDGVRAEQSRAAYRSQDDADRGGYLGLDLDDDRGTSARGGHRGLDDAEQSHAPAHRSHDDADRDTEPVVVQRHTAILDRDDLDQAGESRHAGSRHAAERARAAGRGERAGVGAGQRADSEFAVAGQRTAEQSDQAGQRAPVVAAQATVSRTIPPAGSVVGGQRSTSGSGTEQADEPRRPVGVIRISIPPRDGGARSAGTGTAPAAAEAASPARHTEDTTAPIQPSPEAEVTIGRASEIRTAARHAPEAATGATAQIPVDPTTGQPYGEDTGVVPGTGIWLNRPGSRRGDDSYTSQHGDASVHSGQGVVYGRGATYGDRGAVYGRGGYDTSDGDTTYGGVPRNGGSYGTTYGTGSVYGSATSDARYATGDDSDGGYGYATDTAGQGHAATYGGGGYQTDSTDPYGGGYSASTAYAADEPQGHGDYSVGRSGGEGYAAGRSGNDDHASGGSGDDYASGGSGDDDGAANGSGYGSDGAGHPGEGYPGGGNGYGGPSGYGQPAGQGYQVSGQGYGGHGLEDSLWSGGGQSRGQDRRNWVGGPAGYDPDPRAESFNGGYGRGASGEDEQYGDEGRHSRGRHADEDYTSGRHTDRGWRTEDDLTRSRTTTNQGRFA